VAPIDVYGTARGQARARLASPLAARARARRHAAFFGLTGLRAGMRVLDVGCGTLGLRALEPELEITGVDLAPRPEYPGPFLQADVTAGLPYEDGAFDLVALNNMIPFFDEVARVTASGGHVAVAFSMGPRTPIYVPLERVRAELERRGFSHVANFAEGEGASLLARKADPS
jgi:SAM-dependent methyltransferase